MCRVLIGIMILANLAACIDVDSSIVATISPQVSGFVPSEPGWKTPTAVESSVLYSGNKSFGDYRLAGFGNEALLVGSYFDGLNFRTAGRAYIPVGASGTGWGTLSANLDAGGADITNIATAISQGGEAMVVFGDGALVAQSQSQRYRTGDGFFDTRATVTSTPIKGTHPANGFSSSVAWDGGDAYFSYIDSTDFGFLLRYSGVAGWNTGSEIPLTRGVVQIEMVDDGYAAVAAWLGDGRLAAESLSIGGRHACAVSKQGTAYCWGENAQGQLGDNNVGTDSGIPVSVAGLGSGVSQIAAGFDHTCAIASGGTVYCWGDNFSGQLGDGTTADSDTPVTVLGLSNVIEITAGQNFTCALTYNYVVYCWGENSSSELGDGLGTFVDALLPRAVSLTNLNANTHIEAISAGNSHACAKVSDGSMLCWGLNASGQIGDGNIGFNADTPVEPTGLNAAGADFVKSMAAGQNHTCAVLVDGSLQCWGENGEGQLGDGLAPADRDVPLDVTGLDGSGVLVDRVATGQNHSCALILDQTIRCWGNNDEGQLGSGVITVNQNTPGVVTGVPVKGAVLVAGGESAAILTADGEVLMWGDNASGQLGNNNLGTDSLIAVNSIIRCTANQCSVNVAASDDESFQNQIALSKEGAIARTLALASDGAGTTMVVYLQTVVPQVTCSASVTNCNTRVYAALRTTSGSWVGPIQVDDEFTVANTSLYQDSGNAAIDGLDYPTPQAAYLGSGEFVVVFPLIDPTQNQSNLYARHYRIGSGWSGSATLVESGTLPGSVQARWVNEFALAANGNGDMAILAQYADTPGTSFGAKTFHYNSYSGWVGIDASGIPRCDITQVLCGGLKPQIHIFDTGEAVGVIGAPDSALGTDYRLWSVEYSE